MLSATVGSLDDVVVGEFDSAPEFASPDFSQDGIGLPSGVSLLVCPVANWSESGSGQLAPTSAIETNESIEASGSLSSVIDDSGLLVCTFPPATFSLSGDTDFGDSGDSIAPPTVDPGIDGGQDTVVDPTIIVDPVITDSLTFEPVDVRVQFVSSDPGWAAYYYNVGVDGSVYVWVRASYDEPDIADFVSGDSEARAYATVEDTGDGWVIWNFPTDLAPPVPETGVFAPTGGVVPILETFGNPDPTIIVCPGVSGDGDFGPSDGWSYDGSVSANDLTLEDGTDPVLIACDGYPLAREYCTLVVDFTSIDVAELADSGLSADVRAYSTAVETAPQSPAPVGSPNTVSYSWMAPFAANVPGTGGDSTQPVTVRRRGR